jgi:hypothetical protein
MSIDDAICWLGVWDDEYEAAVDEDEAAMFGE